MTEISHRRFQPSSPRDNSAGNAWDLWVTAPHETIDAVAPEQWDGHVDVTLAPNALRTEPLISSIDWLDGELGSFTGEDSRQ